MTKLQQLLLYLILTTHYQGAHYNSYYTNYSSSIDSIELHYTSSNNCMKSI